MHIRTIQHGTDEYRQMIDLRMRLLRTPLGLTFTEEELDDEDEDLLICAFDTEQIAGCCILTLYKADTIQLRQMAVREDLQAKGIGKKIVAFAEKLAKQRGYRILMMHARNTALDFYKKCGYKLKGIEFIEVGIPHYYMEKKIG